MIGDSAGSGDTGATGLMLSGGGTVVLSATNTYTGGTALDAGTLSLQAPGAAGSGAIAFALGAATTLIVGAGDMPNNIISKCSRAMSSISGHRHRDRAYRARATS